MRRRRWRTIYRNVGERKTQNLTFTLHGTVQKYVHYEPKLVYIHGCAYLSPRQCAGSTSSLQPLSSSLSSSWKTRMRTKVGALLEVLDGQAPIRAQRRFTVLAQFFWTSVGVITSPCIPREPLDKALAGLRSGAMKKGRSWLVTLLCCCRCCHIYCIQLHSCFVTCLF